MTRTFAVLAVLVTLAMLATIGVGFYSFSLDRAEDPQDGRACQGAPAPDQTPAAVGHRLRGAGLGPRDLSPCLGIGGAAHF